MRKQSSIWIFCATLFFTTISSPLVGQDYAPLNGKRIYDQMITSEKAFKSYSVTELFISISGRCSTEKKYKMIDTNGTKLQRIEFPGQVIIDIGNEKWVLIRTSAINCSEYQYAGLHEEENNGKTSPLDKSLENDLKKYPVSDIIYDKTPCYLVKIIYSDETVDGINEKLKEILKEENMTNSTPLDLAPKERLYYIQKSNYVLRAEETYNKNGMRISGRYYSDVKIDEQLPHFLFIIPDNYTKYKVRSDKEFQNVLKKINDLEKPSETNGPSSTLPPTGGTP